MVGAVNERDARVGVSERFAERQAAKACAEHDDMGLFNSSFHADNVNQAREKAITCLQGCK